VSQRIQLGPGLTLPADAVTQTFGVLAVRGAGKSNLGAVMAEEMFDAKLPFVVVDPVGSWWGLRSSGDGKAPGLPIPIFGGRHGDVPLERTGGHLVADLVVDERLSCVLDLSEFSEGDKIRFLIDFAERLYRRNTDPLHLFLEEADDFIPQRPFREQARLLGAWENIVRRGRARGLGMTMITQRSAALNKNVLTQIETLFVLRTTSPQDRKAIAAWVEYHGQAQQLLESLPGLPDGTAWCWSPSWLKVLKQVAIRRRRTFDSGATPKDARGRRAPATVADVDLGALQQRMAATIEKAKAEDPRELKARIRQLEQQLTAKPAPAAVKEKRVEVKVLKDGQLARAEKLVADLRKLVEAYITSIDELRTDMDRGSNALGMKLEAVADEVSAAIASTRIPARGAAEVRTVGAPVVRAPVVSPAPTRRAEGPPTEGLTRPQQRILDALAWLEGVSINDAERPQLGFLANASPRSSSFQNNLGTLRSAGLIEYRGARVALTDSGRGTANHPEKILTAEQLQGAVLAKVSGPQDRILTTLIAAYPQVVARPDLADRAGASATSSSYQNNLGFLRSLGLIDYRDGGVVAQPVLFLENGR